MFTTVDPPGLRADLQLVSGVQSDGKLYEWLSMAVIDQACTVPRWKLVPPNVYEAYKGL